MNRELRAELLTGDVVSHLADVVARLLDALKQDCPQLRKRLEELQIPENWFVQDS
ncbi:MAG TPA: hypothetical protein GXX40_05525 [Firmicutes bacterium]|nr:hypothetical protein [Bacillota bacterium]